MGKEHVYLYPRDADVLPGYRLGAGIGAGGFGEVYEVRNGAGRRFAAKVVTEPEMELRAIDTLIGLQSPYIVHILDVLTTRDGRTALLMEHVDGGTLAEHIQWMEGRDLAARLPEAIRCLLGVLKGVGFLHANGIVHRDIKSANIMIAQDVFKVGDYTLAKPQTDSTKGHITGGKALGTWPYMAPEVVREARCDERSDLWSVGIMFYEVLYGRTPFEGGAPAQVITKIQENLPDLTGLPKDMQRVLRRALNKDPDGRYQTAEKMADDIRDLVSGPPHAGPEADLVALVRHFYEQDKANTATDIAEYGIGKLGPDAPELMALQAQQYVNGEHRGSAEDLAARLAKEYPSAPARRRTDGLIFEAYVERIAHRPRGLDDIEWARTRRREMEAFCRKNPRSDRLEEAEQHLAEATQDLFDAYRKKFEEVFVWISGHLDKNRFDEARDTLDGADALLEKAHRTDGLRPVADGKDRVASLAARIDDAERKHRDDEARRRTREQFEHCTAQVAQRPDGEDEIAWERNRIAVMEDFCKRNPQSPFVTQAQSIMAEARSALMELYRRRYDLLVSALEDLARRHSYKEARAELSAAKSLLQQAKHKDGIEPVDAADQRLARLRKDLKEKEWRQVTSARLIKRVAAGVAAGVAAVVLLAVLVIVAVSKAREAETARQAAEQRREEELARQALKQKLAQRLRTFRNTIGMDFLLIPAGQFTMGSDDGSDNERSPHAVTIATPFYMGKHEVTQGDYEAILGENPSHFKGPDNPVENVSGHDAVEFCRKLSQKEGLDYRLPTEAEWEYACRAGSTGKWCFGDGEGQLADYAWYGEDWRKGSTHPVGLKKSNTWGLCDMHGNVWEWCADWYDQDHHNSSLSQDAGKPQQAEGDVLRGGSWSNIAGQARCARREKGVRGLRNRVYGFRVVLTCAR